MTSGRAAKKAARTRMAATGEPYSAARRAVQGRPSPSPVKEPPAIDPREHALESREWGATTCYLVRHDGRHYAWISWPGAPAVVFAMRGERAGRSFLDRWHAANLLHIGFDERIASVFLLDPADGTRILYDAAVADIAGSGIWLACLDDTARGDEAGPPARFGDLGAALAEFAARADQAAGRIERERACGSPELIAAILRYRAARVRAEAAAAAVGDVIRRAGADADGPLYPALHEAGVSRETLPRVLAGKELAWPQRPAAVPPGARTDKTPVRTLATDVADGRQYSLVSYQDTSGRWCVGIDRDGDRWASLCDVQADGRDLVSAGMSMAARGHGTAVVYGRAHDSVTALYAVMTDGRRVDWPVHDDPGSGRRYFAVVADCGELADIVASAPGRRTSLQRYFGIWFSKEP